MKHISQPVYTADLAGWKKGPVSAFKQMFNFRGREVRREIWLRILALPTRYGENKYGLPHSQCC